MLVLAVVLLVLKILLFLFGLLTLGLGWYLLGGLWIIPAAYSFVFVASPQAGHPGPGAGRAAGWCVTRISGRPSTAQALVYAACFWLTVAAGVVWLLVALVDQPRALPA